MTYGSSFFELLQVQYKEDLLEDGFEDESHFEGVVLCMGFEKNKVVSVFL